MWQTHDMGSGWWLLMVVMLIAVIACVVWLVANTANADHGSPSSPESAMDILDRRLAAGDITIEDYEQRRRALDREREHSAG